MRRIREAYARFMQGRYGQNGADELNRFLVILTLVFLVVSLVLGRVPVIHTVFYWLGVAMLVYSYYRLCSRNIDKRYRENDAYVNFRYNRAVFMEQHRRRMEDMKTHRIYHCPQCRQKVRVPRGKGRIAIRCPKCNTEFIKKT